MMPTAVAIMAKAPAVGTVKTRLTPRLSPSEAAALSQCFLLDKIEQVRTLEHAHPVIAYTPTAARALFEVLAPDFTLIPQQGADLSTRLVGVLGSLLGQGHPGVIAIDSDTPTLPTAFLQQGVDRLASGEIDLVVGPSDDGGYYLIGLRAPRPELFADMPWSTSHVLSETLRRARTAGLSVSCLPAWFDVDTPADLARLEASLVGLGPAAPAHTARFIAEHRR